MQGLSIKLKLCMTLSDIVKLKHLIKFDLESAAGITLVQTNSKPIYSIKHVSFYVGITWHTQPIISCLNSILLENIILKHFISPLGLICILLLHSLCFELVRYETYSFWYTTSIFINRLILTGKHGYKQHLVGKLEFNVEIYAKQISFADRSYMDIQRWKLIFKFYRR